MKVCYVYQDQYPWDVRVEKIASSLSTSGIETHIVSRNRSGLAKLEKLAELIYIHRLPKGFGPFSRNLMNFPAFFSPFWIAAITTTVRRCDINLIMVRDLPLGPAAYWAGKITGVPVVMDMAENYPAMIQDTWTFRGPTPWDYVLRNPVLLKKIECWLLPRLDGVLVVSDYSRERVYKLAGPQTPIWIVSNTPRINGAVTIRQHSIVERIKQRKGMALLYVGGLEESRGLEIVIQALPRIVDKDNGFLFVIIGKGTSEESLRKLAYEQGVENHVYFAGWVDQADIPAAIAESDCCIVPHYVTEHTDTTVPNKIFDYMLQKKPVIVTDSRSLRWIVESTGCGKVYADKNHEELLQAIMDLTDPEKRKILGESGYSTVLDKYNWTIDEKILLEAVRRFGAVDGNPNI